MSTYTPITLVGRISTFTGQLTYGETDGTGLQNEFQTYSVTITNISPQTTGDGSTREGNQYNGLDVETGMWIADTSGKVVHKIISIQSKNSTSLELTVEDVDMLSFRLSGQNTIATSSNVVIFNTNAEGEAIIVNTGAFSTGAIDLIQSKFQLNESDDRVKFEHAVAPSVTEGDIVTINSSGGLVKYGDTAAATSLKMGTVVERIKAGKSVFVKPFNDIIRGYKDPESLTGSPGAKYYTDTNNDGKITTSPGGKESYLQLNTAIPTQIFGTNSTIPGAGDVVIINDITIFDGPDGDTVADISAFSTLINTFSSQTNVTSTAAPIPVSVDSEDNKPQYADQDYYSSGDSYIATGPVGGAQTYPEITITDGVQPAVTIVFDNPTDTMNVGGTDYNVITPADIKSKFDGAISSGSLDLITELYDMNTYDGQGVRITTTGSASGITLTNTVNGLFGTPAVGANSWTGIGTSATLGGAVLTLTRASGGPIQIDGTPLSGGYINQGGIVSSNSGRVPYLLLIEDEVGATETGVETSDDLDWIPNNTSADGDYAGITITYTPYADSNVQVTINGLAANVGDGVKTKDCYFSGDNGVTARAIADITAGDQLHWNGSIAGYELETTDLVDIIYDASSNDL